MTKDTLKTIGVWCTFFGIIAIAVFGIRSCNKREEANKKQAKLERILHGKYVYEDINGVYHIDEHCRMLRKHFYDAEDNEIYENYSSEYMPRSIIQNWSGFASTHQLCTKCFSPMLIEQLDSVHNTYKQINKTNTIYINTKSQQVLEDFMATMTANPNISPVKLLELFPEFNNDTKILNAAFDYREARLQNPYAEISTINSKFLDLFIALSNEK